MHDAMVVERLDDPEGLVPPGHVFAFGRAISVSAPSFFSSGSGGVAASAEDMARWLLFQAKGGVTSAGLRVLSEASMDLMHRASAPDSRYGFGWVDQSSRQPPRILHSGWTPTFTAFQSLSLDGSHDVAILSNGGRTFLNGSIAAYIARRVWAVEAGLVPQSYGESTRVLDLMLVGASLIVLATTLLALWRTARWTQRAMQRALWRQIVGLAPLGIIVAIVFSIPKIFGDALGGRETGWSIVMQPSAWVWLFYVSPVGVVCCVAVALSCLVLLCVRTASLMKSSNNRVAQGPES